MTTPVDRSPVRFASGVAVAAALVAALASGLYSLPAFAAGLPGVALVGAGVGVGRRRGTRWVVTVGAAVLLAGVVVAGVFGAPEMVLLLATVATVLAWDAGGTAIDIGRQLGREAESIRVQLVHLGSTAIVGGLTAAIGFGIYRTVTAGQPLTALVLLLVAALLLTETLSG
ncbi:MAG: hypothetical protein ABEJ30_00830 [Halorientalis sp.]